MDDGGNYIVTISAAEMSRLVLPKDKYHYAVRITEGDTGERWRVIKGELYLEDLPL